GRARSRRGWSLCGLSSWPIDNRAADRDENAESIPHAKRARFALVPRANGPRVPSGTVFTRATRAGQGASPPDRDVRYRATGVAEWPVSKQQASGLTNG